MNPTALHTVIRVRETIHHGDFHNTREVSIEPTWNGFVEMLGTSTYPVMSDRSGDNRYTAMAFAWLLTTGAAQIGWIDYKVIGV